MEIKMHLFGRFLGICCVLATVVLLTMTWFYPTSARQHHLMSSSIGGPFELIDQDGHSFSQADLKGHPHLVFFGYTHCPDICPTTLAQLTQILDQLHDPSLQGV